MDTLPFFFLNSLPDLNEENGVVKKVYHIRKKMKRQNVRYKVDTSILSSREKVVYQVCIWL